MAQLNGEALKVKQKPPKTVMWQEFIDPLDTIYEEAETKCLDTDGDIIKIQKRPLVAIHQGLGATPIKPEHFASHLCKFFVGHTNFDLDTNAQLKIVKVDGVEKLDPWTRYRFRVGIGEAFDKAEVLKSIKDVLVNEPVRPMRVYNEYSEVGLMVRELSKTFKFWAIYVCPNEELDCMGSDDEYKAKLYVEQVYRRCKEGVGGLIIVSWPDESQSQSPTG